MRIMETWVLRNPEDFKHLGSAVITFIGSGYKKVRD